MSELVEFVTVTVSDEETTITVHGPEFFFKHLKLSGNSSASHPFPVRVLLQMRERLLTIDSMNKREYRRLMSLGITEHIPLPDKITCTWDVALNERFARDLYDYIQDNLQARPVYPHLLWYNN